MKRLIFLSAVILFLCIIGIIFLIPKESIKKTTNDFIPPPKPTVQTGGNYIDIHKVYPPKVSTNYRKWIGRFTFTYIDNIKSKRKYVCFVAPEVIASNYYDGPYNLLWDYTQFKQYDTVFVSFSEGFIVKAIIDSLFWTGSAYGYSGYSYRADIIDTNDYKYLTEKSLTDCLVFKDKIKNVNAFCFSQMDSSTSLENQIINAWAIDNYQNMYREWNVFMNENKYYPQIFFSKNDSLTISINVNKIIHLPSNIKFYLIDINWKNLSNNKFGISAVGNIVDTIFKPIWLEKWFLYPGEAAHQISICSFCLCDTIGIGAVLMENRYYEGRKNQVYLLLPEKNIFIQDTTYLDIY